MERNDEGTYHFKLNGKTYKLEFEGDSPRVTLSGEKQIAKRILRDYILQHNLPIDLIHLSKEGIQIEKTTNQLGKSFREYLGLPNLSKVAPKPSNEIKMKTDNRSIIIQNEIDELVVENYDIELIKQSKKYLDQYLESKEKLYSLNILKNRRDFTSQIGEWFVSNLLNGKLSDNGIQKDWDLEVNEKKIQIKSHSKSINTSARWTSIKYNENAEIDFLAIIVFNEKYKIKEFYFLKWIEAYKLVRSQKHDKVLNWRDISDYKVDLTNLINNDLIKMFL